MDPGPDFYPGTVDYKPASDPVFAGYSLIRQNRIQIWLRFKSPDPDLFRLYYNIPNIYILD